MNAEYDVFVDGIPAIAQVTHYHNEPGARGASAHSYDSDADYYGYTELDFEVRDRKGYQARWLERKFDDPWVEESVRDQILEAMGVED